MPGGMPARIDGIVTQLKKGNWSIEVITPIFYEYTTVLVDREAKSIKKLNLRWLSSLRLIPASIAKLIGNVIFSFFAFAIIASKVLGGTRNGLIVQYQDVYSAPPAIMAGILFRLPVIGDDVRLYHKDGDSLASWLGRAFETYVLKHTDYIVTSFRLDFNMIKEIRNNENVLFVPNGIKKCPASRDVPRNPLCLLFVAQFANAENIEALRSVLRIAHKLSVVLPEAKISIVGGPIESIGNVIKKVRPNTENLNFLGRISNLQLSSLYEEAGIGILPYFGCSEHTSQRIKVLEYLSHGLLVIASPEAVDGFEQLRDGSHFLLAKNPEAMIALLEKIVPNYSRFSKIADDGRNFVNRHYSWDTVAHPYLKLTESLKE